MSSACFALCRSYHTLLSDKDLKMKRRDSTPFMEILFLKCLLFHKFYAENLPSVIISLASGSIKVAGACSCMDYFALEEFFYSAKSQGSTKTSEIVMDNCLCHRAKNWITVSSLIVKKWKGLYSFLIAHFVDN